MQERNAYLGLSDTDSSIVPDREDSDEDDRGEFITKTAVTLYCIYCTNEKISYLNAMNQKR